MKRNDLRKVEFIDLNGKRRTVYFHKWVVANDGLIVGLVEDEDGGMHSVLLERIRFID